MIEGTPINKHFTRVYASGFMYDHNDIAHWSALAVNYTTNFDPAVEVATIAIGDTVITSYDAAANGAAVKELTAALETAKAGTDQATVHGRTQQRRQWRSFALRVANRHGRELRIKKFFFVHGKCAERQQ